MARLADPNDVALTVTMECEPIEDVPSLSPFHRTFHPGPRSMWWDGDLAENAALMFIEQSMLMDTDRGTIVVRAPAWVST